MAESAEYQCSDCLAESTTIEEATYIQTFYAARLKMEA